MVAMAGGVSGVREGKREKSPKFGDFEDPGRILGGLSRPHSRFFPAEDGPVPRPGAGAAAQSEAVPAGHRRESGKGRGTVGS